VFEDLYYFYRQQEQHRYFNLINFLLFLVVASDLQKRLETITIVINLVFTRKSFN
jgi:hypothetical protein